MHIKIPLVIMLLTVCSIASGGKDDLNITITKSTVIINGQSIHIDDFGNDMHQFEGTTETLPFPNPSDDERFSLKNFPISFSQYNRTYNSIYIWLSDSRFDEFDIEHFDFTVSERTSKRQFEKILDEAKVKYRKYEYEWEPKGSFRIDSSGSEHPIVQARFKEFKLSGIEIRLKKVSPPDPVPDKFSNKKEVQCASFREEDELLTYTTELAKIEIRKTDLVKLINRALEENPPKAGQIESQLKDLDSCTNLEKLNFPLLYYARNALSGLLKDGKCRVFDRKTNKYITSFIAADWDGYTAGGDGFLLLGSIEAFFTNINWIT